MYYSYTIDTPRCSVTIHHFKVQSLFVSLQVASVLIMEHNLEHLTLLVEFVHDPPKRDANIKIALVSSSPKTRPECSTPKLRSPNMVPLWICFKTTNLWHFYSKKTIKNGIHREFPNKIWGFPNIQLRKPGLHKQITILAGNPACCSLVSLPEPNTSSLFTSVPVSSPLIAFSHVFAGKSTIKLVG